MFDIINILGGLKSNIQKLFEFIELLLYYNYNYNTIDKFIGSFIEPGYSKLFISIFTLKL